jgi:ParB-like chromosome segregation protein Spo0J
MNQEWSADRVERRSVATLLPDARNARTHSDEQVAQIAASIREHQAGAGCFDAD